MTALPPAQDPPTSVRDWGLSWIRTGVPILWGYLLTWLAMRAPDLHDLLDNPYVAGAVVGAVTLAWYALMRWVEPKLPPWLTRIVLGSNHSPLYPRTVPGEVVASQGDIPRPRS